MYILSFLAIIFLGTFFCLIVTLGSLTPQDKLALFAVGCFALLACPILIVNGILRFSKGPLSKKILRYLAKIRIDELKQIRVDQKVGEQHKIKKEINGR